MSGQDESLERQDASGECDHYWDYVEKVRTESTYEAEVVVDDEVVILVTVGDLISDSFIACDENYVICRNCSEWMWIEGIIER